MTIHDQLYLQIKAIEDEFDIQIIPIVQSTSTTLKTRIFEAIRVTSEAEIRYAECMRRIRDWQEFSFVGGISTPVARDRILFVASNPNNLYRIRTDKEYKSLKQLLYDRPEAKLLLLMPHLASSSTDFGVALSEHRPAILHFAGHGERDMLMFETENGLSEGLAKDKLEALFSKHRDHLHTAVLNACFSAVLTNDFSVRPRILVGCCHETIDPVALAFTKGFYTSLSDSASCGEQNAIAAFNAGCDGLRNVTKEAGDTIYKLVESP